MKLFSEVYGCYFTVMSKILKQAELGIGREEIENMVDSYAFSESAFHLLPKLFSGDWNLLEKKTDGKYYAKPQLGESERPMTSLEMAWLKALLLDKRIRLFVTQSEIEDLNEALSDVTPLFTPDDFHMFDVASDGDSYEDEDYIQNFQVIMNACKEKTPLRIEYESAKQKRLVKYIVPYKLNYSSRDDKFRLLGVLFQNGKCRGGVTLNLGRIRLAENSDIALPGAIQPEKFFEHIDCPEPVVLEISQKRRALQRCMLQFACWEKQTEYDEETGRYLCKIYYDKQEETELLIRILSFGPVVKVLGPRGFLRQVKKRIEKQYQLNISRKDESS